MKISRSVHWYNKSNSTNFDVFDREKEKKKQKDIFIQLFLVRYLKNNSFIMSTSFESL